jgi:hypothetical protein
LQNPCVFGFTHRLGGRRDEKLTSKLRITKKPPSQNSKAAFLLPAYFRKPLTNQQNIGENHDLSSSY